MPIVMPRRAAVIPVGAPGCGKSTVLARIGAALEDPGFRHGPDDVRLLAFGTRAYQGAGGYVHQAARCIYAARLASGRPVGYDATNTTRSERRPLVQLAQRHGTPPVALLFTVGTDQLLHRNAERPPAEVVPEDVLQRFADRVARLTAGDLRSEGFADVHELRGATGVEVELRG